MEAAPRGSRRAWRCQASWFRRRIERSAARAARATILEAGRNARSCTGGGALPARAACRPRRPRKPFSTRGFLLICSRSARSSAVFLAKTLGSSRPLYSPVYAFCAFSRPKIREAACRACSAPWARIPAQRLDASFHDLEARGIHDVALGFELGDRVVAVRRRRVARDEHRFLIGGAFRVPLQVLVGLDRLAVLVDAEDGEVEIVTRIREVVGIAAEERHLLFGREHEPHVRVFLVAVQPVLRALIERHDVRPKPGAIRRSPFRCARSRLCARRAPTAPMPPSRRRRQRGRSRLRSR